MEPESEPSRSPKIPANGTSSAGAKTPAPTLSACACGVLISEQQLALIITLMQNYWKAFTGSEFKFHFTSESKPYLLPPKHRISREVRMQLTCDRPPRVGSAWAPAAS